MGRYEFPSFIMNVSSLGQIDEDKYTSNLSRWQHVNACGVWVWSVG